MLDHTPSRVFPAIVFGVRARLYAFEQHGSATLLPWLQRYAAPSPMPGLPAWCLGLLNVHGTVQMVADLGLLLGYEHIDPSENSRLIFIERGTSQLGLLADLEVGFRYLRPSETAEIGLGRRFAASTALLENRLVTVLDGAAIIRHIAGELRAPASET